MCRFSDSRNALKPRGSGAMGWALIFGALEPIVVGAFRSGRAALGLLYTKLAEGGSPVCGADIDHHGAYGRCREPEHKCGCVLNIQPKYEELHSLATEAPSENLKQREQQNPLNLSVSECLMLTHAKPQLVHYLPNQHQPTTSKYESKSNFMYFNISLPICEHIVNIFCVYL